MKVLVTQLCVTLCDPMDHSWLGSSVRGILQARILEWVTISFSRGSLPPGIEPRSPALRANSLLSEPWGKPWHKAAPLCFCSSIFESTNMFTCLIEFFSSFSKHYSPIYYLPGLMQGVGRKYLYTDRYRYRCRYIYIYVLLNTIGKYKRKS